MLERLMSLSALSAAAALVMCFGQPSQPQVAASPVASAAPKPQCDAAEEGKCECFDKGGCKCAKGKQCKAKSALRDLTTNETLDVYARHITAINAWVEANNLGDSDHSMRELVQLWLTENPKHDPRLSKQPTTPVDLPAPGGEEVVDEHPVSKAAPLYTQPQPAAKPQAAPKPVVRYATHRLEYRPTYGRFGRQTGGQWVYVPIQQPKQYQPQQRHYRTCSNGSCR